MVNEPSVFKPLKVYCILANGAESDSQDQSDLCAYFFNFSEILLFKYLGKKCNSYDVNEI